MFGEPDGARSGQHNEANKARMSDASKAEADTGDNNTDPAGVHNKSPSPSTASTPRKDEVEKQKRERETNEDDPPVAAAPVLEQPRLEAEDVVLPKEDPLHTMDWLSCEQAALASVEEVQNVLKVRKKENNLGDESIFESYFKTSSVARFHKY